LRLAARLAREAGGVHPSDWIAVYESHTPLEWMVQLCLSYVDPWGDDRADLRAAFNTVKGMQITDEAEAQKAFDQLRDYVTTDDENDLYDEDALAAVRDT
jgi:hypothetical protein